MLIRLAVTATKLNAWLNIQLMSESPIHVWYLTLTIPHTWYLFPLIFCQKEMFLQNVSIRSCYSIHKMLFLRFVKHESKLLKHLSVFSTLRWKKMLYLSQIQVKTLLPHNSIEIHHPRVLFYLTVGNTFGLTSQVISFMKLNETFPFGQTIVTKTDGGRPHSHGYVSAIPTLLIPILWWIIFLCLFTTFSCFILFELLPFLILAYLSHHPCLHDILTELPYFSFDESVHILHSIWSSCDNLHFFPYYRPIFPYLAASCIMFLTLLFILP